MRVRGSKFAVETVNATCWASAKAWLESTRAHIILLQEHRLVSKEKIDEAKVWLANRGMTGLFTPGFRTPKGGYSSGTAVIAVNWLGLRLLPGSSTQVVVEGRATGGRWTSRGGRPGALTPFTWRVG